jgi:DNA-binding XRE family transcriptional regulator
MFLRVRLRSDVDVRATIATNIRRYRRRGALSQEALAHQIGKSERWLIEVEAGRVDIKLLDAIQLAEVLRIHLADLHRPAETQQQTAR